jgi:hypothetical protein
MIDTNAFQKSNDAQTEKAFDIARTLLEAGHAAAVSGGCARRCLGLSRWMNDADIITNAPIGLIESVCDAKGMKHKWPAEYKVTCADEWGFYDVVRRDNAGVDPSAFNHHELNWRFHHRAIALDPFTMELVRQEGEEVLLTREVVLREHPEKLMRWDPYWSYMGLAYACRENVPFDERLLEVMKAKPNLAFFPGLCFKIISYAILGRDPSRSMDRLLESNLLRKTPNLEKAWSSASEQCREDLDLSHGCFMAPWMVLLRMDPAIYKDLLAIHFPERWLGHGMGGAMFFPLLDKSERDHDWWPYWHVRNMYRNIAFPPKDVAKRNAITNRPTPFPFP